MGIAAGTDVTEEALHRFCNEHLTADKTPATWMFVETMPLTAYGKIRKNVLGKQLA